MSTDRDTTRIVRSWLEEGATALPDRVLDAVLDQLPATSQRRASWPARRFRTMTMPIRIAVAAAALVAVAVAPVCHARADDESSATTSSADKSPRLWTLLRESECIKWVS